MLSRGISMSFILTNFYMLMIRPIFNEALNTYLDKSYTPICRFDLCKTNVDALQTVLQNIIENRVRQAGK